MDARVEPSARKLDSVTGEASGAGFDATAISRLHELAGGDVTFARGLVQKWLAEYPARVREVVSALDAGDLPLAERVAHTLKSSCGILGAMAMAEACQQIESAAAQQQLGAARAGVIALEQAAGLVEPLLTAEVSVELSRTA